jgi:dethiobiotin synthetase
VIPTLFVTSPGTGAGKTLVARALTSALRARGRRVAALKPIETGVDPDPLDAQALAHAAGQPAHAHHPALYRARPPVSPYAALLEGHGPTIDLPRLIQHIHATAADADVILVEGAGGLLVPLDATHDIADLALALRYPLLLVARDELGVLSHVLTCTESARARGLHVAAVILSRAAAALDASTRTNQRVLESRLSCPVRIFPHAARDDDASLAHAAEALGLPALLGLV